MDKLLVLTPILIDARTIQMIKSVYGYIPSETKCIEFSEITGIKTAPLSSHLIPNEIELLTLEQFLGIEDMKKYHVLSLLPNTKHTYQLFKQLRDKVSSIATVSMFIPWESSFKCFIRTWAVKLLLAPDKVYAYGKFRFASIMSRGTVEYRVLPNMPMHASPTVKKESRVIVFVDQAIPTHPDCSVTGKNVDASQYYKRITETLISLSQQLDAKVVICRHPKGDYKGDEFSDLEIAIEATEKAMVSASYIVGHYSMALITAALNDLPIIILDVSEVVTQAIFKETSAFSRLLGIQQYRIGVDFKVLGKHIAKNTRQSKLVESYLFGVMNQVDFGKSGGH